MAKKVILATAGAGKTYFICHHINPEERNLVLAYTHENISNIRHELRHAFQVIPLNTIVSTFDAFLYSQCILPYWSIILASFKTAYKKLRGVTFNSPPQRTIKRNGKYVPNPYYRKQTDITHYLDDSGRIYCSCLAELLVQSFKNDKCLFHRIVKRINMFFDNVLIDEFQDFREYDYSLIIKLSKQLNSILLVGDYYQHSVSGSNNSGQPFKLKNKEVSYEDFCKQLRSYSFEVDASSLMHSRRCSLPICEFVSRKLGISITSSKIHSGEIKWVPEDQIEKILNDDRIIKLVYRDSDKYCFNSINWSMSKGNTYNEICVILTDKFKTIDDEKFSPVTLSQITINKLYVALTRSTGNVYLVKYSSFKRLKDKYYRS